MIVFAFLYLISGVIVYASFMVHVMRFGDVTNSAVVGAVAIASFPVINHALALLVLFRWYTAYKNHVNHS
jgi:hypothetical protein